MIIKIVIWGVGLLVGVYVLLVLLFYFLQFKLLFHPVALPIAYRYSFNQPFEEIFIDYKGDSINALYFKSEAKKGCVVYYHGNAGNLSSWGSIATDFTLKGFDFLVVDYPSFGKSTGELSETSLLKMGTKVYEHALKNYPPEKIILYGRSIGTGIASKVAGENKVGLLILESPYISIQQLANHHAPKFIPVSFILRLRFDNRENLKLVRCPTYLFHGTDDEIIPYNHSTHLEKSLKKGDKLVSIGGGKHNNLNQYKIYHEKLMEALLLIR